MRLTSRGFAGGMPREIGHFLVAHVAHFHRRRLVTLIAPMAIIAAETFAITAVIANKNISLKMRAKHVDFSSVRYW